MVPVLFTIVASYRPEVSCRPKADISRSYTGPKCNWDPVYKHTAQTDKWRLDSKQTTPVPMSPWDLVCSSYKFTSSQAWMEYIATTHTDQWVFRKANKKECAKFYQWIWFARTVWIDEGGQKTDCNTLKLWGVSWKKGQDQHVPTVDQDGLERSLNILEKKQCRFTPQSNDPESLEARNVPIILLTICEVVNSNLEWVFRDRQAGPGWIKFFDEQDQTVCQEKFHHPDISGDACVHVCNKYWKHMASTWAEWINDRWRRRAEYKSNHGHLNENAETEWEKFDQTNFCPNQMGLYPDVGTAESALSL